MASILKRSRKPGAPWYVVYNDATGKQRWVKGYTDHTETKKLANDLENQKTKIQRGDIDPQQEARKVERARPAAVHVDDYEAHLKAKGVSDNHVAYTIADIRKCLDFTGVTHASGITAPMISRWVNTLRAGDDSHSTINRRVKSVQAWLRWLREHTGIAYTLNKFPRLPTKGKETRHRRALTSGESALLLATAPAERKELYRFAMLTGARHTQASALAVKDLNFSQKTVNLKPKGKDRTHIVPMHAALIGPLRKLCEGRGRDDLIFPGIPSKDRAAGLVRADCKAAGIDTTHVDFHALRHTFITRLAEANVHPKVLQQLAGHASLETTLGFYVHFRRDDEHSAVALLPG